MKLERAGGPASSSLVQGARAKLAEILPPNWIVRDAQDGTERGSWNDGLFTIQSPLSQHLELVYVVRSSVAPKEATLLIDAARNLAAHTPRGLLVLAPYISEPVRRRLQDAGVSFIDGGGNVFVRSDRAALYMLVQGVSRDPRKGAGRPMAQLKGEPAAKVVRALLDFPGPWGVRDLISVSAASTGSVYRVLEFLEAQELITRGTDGAISVSSKSALARRWAEDYDFLRVNKVSRQIDPRGVRHFLSVVAAQAEGFGSAVTASAAAEHWAPYAPVRSAMLYVRDLERFASEHGLTEVDQGANVLLIEPKYSVVLERTQRRDDGVIIVSPWQAVVDLLNGPGRAPAEAEELIAWLERRQDDD